MSIRKRKWTTRLGEAKEAWVVDYADQHGERHIKTFARKKEADDYRTTVKVDVKAGTHIAPSKSVTVAEAAGKWLARGEAEGLERTTLDGYREHVRLYILPQLGKAKLASLTLPKVEAFRDYLLTNTRSRARARHVWSSFKAVLRHAKCSHVTDGASITIRKRENGVIKENKDYPTPGEIGRLIDAATTPRWRALLLTAALTGLRASELRGLCWADVKLDKGELDVCQRADRYGAIGAPKSAASTRTVPLAPEVLSALKVWKLACPKGDLGLVFPTRTGRPERHTNLLRSLDRIMLAAHVVDKDGKPKYAMHAFRHFFASWCINRKADGGRELPARLVQALLGHSTVSMTLNVYGHLFPRGDDKAELAQASAALLARR
jgi:integrase